jgi:3-oxoacyl-[acyl-carrier protein] reductase
MFASMQGRTAIVTGASRGIGRGIAARFAAAGMNVLVVARQLADAERTAREIAEAGGSASGCAADVSDTEATRAMAATALDRYGTIDILCANAGIFPRARIDSMTAADFDAMTDVNLKGTFLSVQACLGAMKAKNHGRVVIVGSITGTTGGYPGYSHYAASKAGQLGFMRCAAIELAPWQITVNAVLPGNVRTDEQPEQKSEYQRKKLVMSALGRLASVEDIANGALFLASREAGAITGQTLIVDGGQSLPESPSAVEEAMAAAGKD